MILWDVCEMIHENKCQAIELGDQYCNCKYRFQEATLKTMTAKKKRMTIPVFCRYLRERFLSKLAVKEEWTRDEVSRTWDDCLRDTLLEELERRDKDENTQ